jgi:hypothetical protein
MISQAGALSMKVEVVWRVVLQKQLWRRNRTNLPILSIDYSVLSQTARHPIW